MWYIELVAHQHSYINISNPSIKKHMSDGAAMLAYSGYFLCHPRPCLNGLNEAKYAGGGLAAGSIRGISARGASV